MLFLPILLLILAVLVALGVLASAAAVGVSLLVARARRAWSAVEAENIGGM